jgi:hypothetical protein
MKSFTVKGKPAKKRGNPIPPSKPFKSKKNYNRKKCGNEPIEDSVNIRSLLSKFVTNIFEKKYSEANSTLSNIITEKVKKKIETTAKNKKCGCDCDNCKKNIKKNIKK